MSESHFPCSLCLPFLLNINKIYVPSRISSFPLRKNVSFLKQEIIIIIKIIIGLATLLSSTTQPRQSSLGVTIKAIPQNLMEKRQVANIYESIVNWGILNSSQLRHLLHIISLDKIKQQMTIIQCYLIRILRHSVSSTEHGRKHGIRLTLC